MRAERHSPKLCYFSLELLLSVHIGMIDGGVLSASTAFVDCELLLVAFHVLGKVANTVFEMDFAGFGDSESFSGF